MTDSDYHIGSVDGHQMGRIVDAVEKLRCFILENYLFTDDQSALDNSDSFLDKGVLDSTGILEVIYFIEDEFGVRIEDEEMIPANLDSVNNIVNFLERKRI